MRIGIGLPLCVYRAIVAMALLAAYCRAAGGVAQQPSISDVGSAWKAREGRIKSATFVWEDVKFIAARSVAPRKPSRNDSDFLPKEDVTFQRSVELLLSGNMMRYSYDGQVYNPTKGGIRQKRYVSVCDGRTSKNFHQMLDGEQEDFPLSGFIRSDAIHYDFDNREILPVLITCRPCNEHMGGVDLSTYEVGAKVANIDDQMCYVLQPRVPLKKQWQKSYWVDPDRDYIVLRITCGRSGYPPVYTVDIKHTQANSREYIPSAWKLIETGGSTNRILSQRSVSVTDYEINEDIAKSEFQFEFPPDTAIVDNRTNERSIMRENGEKRVVTHSELSRGAKYPDLVATKSGQAALGNKTSRVAAFACMSVFALLLTLFFVLRRRNAN